MNLYEDLGWPFFLSRSAFVAMGLATALLIPFCYAPDHVAVLLGGFGPKLLATPLLKVATADRSGATLACLTLACLALARYFVLRERRRRQEEHLVRWGKALAGSGKALEALARTLPVSDPVGAYLQQAYESWRSHEDAADESLELLHRGLAREDLRLRRMVTPLVVLGLLGTLLGVFIGFLLTFGEGQGLELQAALRQAIVVVATACLSSVWGIGLGQLLVAPLSDRLTQRTNEVFDRAIAVDNLLR